MKGQLESLIRLQENDTQFGLTSHKKASHPKQLEEAQRPLLAAQKDLEKTRATLEAVSKTKRGKEGDLQAQEEQIEKLKGRQSSIKTNKEYHALLQEVEAANQAKGHLEEALLLLMEESDNQNRKVHEHEQLVKEAENNFKSKERELAAEAVHLDETISKLESERVEIAKQLEGNLLRDYEHLKPMRKDLVVVPVVQGACGGCQMTLPPQLVAEVKLETEIHTCSYCHRILFYRHPAEQNKALWK